MSQKNVYLLRQSIAKWEKNARVTTLEDAKLGMSECPLCHEYAVRNEGASCVGCPIMKYTGRPSCINTPYYDAEDAYGCGELSIFTAAAREEVKFLRRVLEAELVQSYLTRKQILFAAAAITAALSFGFLLMLIFAAALPKPV